jgi:hypothetical protein
VDPRGREGLQEEQRVLAVVGAHLKYHARVVAEQLSQQFAVDGVAGDGRKRARHGAERTAALAVFEECKAAGVKDARAHVGHERPIWRQADGGGGLKGPAFGVGTAYVRMERVESGDRAR